MGQYQLDDLLRLMANLRDPQRGCPWDREQTLASIVPHTLDEVYEVIDTIERQDHQHLCDELGDLLFQVVFYARISEEAGRFDFADIIQGLVEKLLRRHPHVFPAGTLASFGSGSPLSEVEIKRNWERIKAQERAAKEAQSTIAAAAPASVLDDISRALPALPRAHKLQKRAATVGFDWSALAPVVDNLEGELRELREAIAQQDPTAIADELGDLLFSCVNLSRHLQQDAEQVLRQANGKFERRFRRVEQLAQRAGLAINQADEAQLDRLWQQAKRELAAERD